MAANRMLSGKEMGNCVYIGYDQNGLFKIGMTNNYERRLKQIQNMNPNFNFLCLIPCKEPAVLEATLHLKFSEKRMVGEWFSLSAEGIKYILDTYQDFSPTMEILYPAWKDAVGKGLWS